MKYLNISKYFLKIFKNYSRLSIGQSGQVWVILAWFHPNPFWNEVILISSSIFIDKVYNKIFKRFLYYFWVNIM
jgi:hypothetical protein